jgi:hypothetical protein
VDLGVAFQVVASDEALLAVVTSELTIAEMSLDMGFDVLFPAELLVAVVELADPFVIDRIWSLDILRNVIQSDIGLFDRCLDARLEVKIGD